MERIARLIENNRRWSERKTIEDPNFFVDLAAQQTPDFLWIGCSDSRVEASRIVGMSPGEIFVHRNVANLVVHTDINCLSVIQFAVEVLKIEHIIVCGHYGCGGVKAALETDSHGLIDNWLRNIRETAYLYASELNAIGEMEQKIDRLCELNVARQVLNVCETTIVRDAWNRGQKLMIHGWIYGLTDGLIRDLGHTNIGQQEARESRTNFMAGRG